MNMQSRRVARRSSCLGPNTGDRAILRSLSTAQAFDLGTQDLVCTVRVWITLIETLKSSVLISCIRRVREGERE